MKENYQIKSRERVSKHGEVFTPEKEVNLMINLVHKKVQNIDAKFLEPACGEGNFLVAILKEKINFLVKQKELTEKNVFRVVCSIYGIELLKDNAEICVNRLLETIHSFTSLTDKYDQSFNYILNKNIQCGDALKLQNNDGTQLYFSDWSFQENEIVESIYELSKIIESNEYREEGEEKINLFESDDWETMANSINKPLKINKYSSLTSIGKNNE